MIENIKQQWGGLEKKRRKKEMSARKSQTKRRN